MSSFTVGSGKDYATLQAWYDAHNIDGGAVDAVCYSGSDLGTLSIPGSPVFDSMSITVAAGHRHNGTDAGTTGVAYSSGRVRVVLDQSNNASFTLKNLRVHERIEIYTDSNAPAVRLDGNLVLVAGNAASATPAAIYLHVADSVTTGAMTLRVYNNIILWKSTSGISNALQLENGTGGDGANFFGIISNNTVIRSSGSMQCGILLANGSVDDGIVFTNNIAMGASSTDFLQGGSPDLSGSGYNLSSDATGDDFGAVGSLINQTASAVVVAPATDPTLVAGSPALNAGTNSGTFFTNDAIGTVRPQGGTWDMGAMELIVAVTNVVAGAKRFWKGRRRR